METKKDLEFTKQMIRKESELDPLALLMVEHTKQLGMTTDVERHQILTYLNRVVDDGKNPEELLPGIMYKTSVICNSDILLRDISTHFNLTNVYVMTQTINLPNIG